MIPLAGIREASGSRQTLPPSPKIKNLEIEKMKIGKVKIKILTFLDFTFLDFHFSRFCPDRALSGPPPYLICTSGGDARSGARLWTDGRHRPMAILIFYYFLILISTITGIAELPWSMTSIPVCYTITIFIFYYFLIIISHSPPRPPRGCAERRPPLGRWPASPEGHFHFYHFLY